MTSTLTATRPRWPGASLSGAPTLHRITICAVGRERLFGAVSGGAVVLSPAGRVVQVEWLRTAYLRPAVQLDRFVIMPDHFHAILGFDESESNGSLASIIAGFKAGSALRINQLRGTPGGAVWQRLYRRQVLHPMEAECARQHLLTNPERWMERDTVPAPSR